MRPIHTILTALMLLISTGLMAQSRTLAMLQRCIDSTAMAGNALRPEINAAKLCAESFADAMEKALTHKEMEPLLRSLEQGRVSEASDWVTDQDSMPIFQRYAMMARLSVLGLQLADADEYYHNSLRYDEGATFGHLLEYARYCQTTGLIHKAQDLTQRALQAAKNPTEEYQGRMQMSWVLLELNEPDKALTHTNHLQAMRIKPKPRHMEASINMAKAEAYMLKDEPDMAMIYYTQAMGEYKKSKDLIREPLLILCEQSSIHTMRGQHQEAAQCLQQALEYAGRYPNEVDLNIAKASVYLQWGMVMKATGRLDEAREKLHASLQTIGQTVMRNRSYVADLAEIEASLAAIEIDLKDYRRAEALCEDAYNIYSQGRYAASPKAIQGKAGLLRTYGNLYTQMGLYMEAGRKYSESLTTYQRLIQTHNMQYDAEMALVFNNMGTMYEQMGNLSDAITNYKTAAKNLGKVQQSHPRYMTDYANTLANIGNIYRKYGKQDSSLKYMEEALTIFRQKTTMNDSEKSEYAKICNNLGLQYRSMGSYDIAEPFFETAYMTGKYLQSRSDAYKPLWADILNNYGLFHVDTGDMDLGLYYMNQALEIRQETTRNSEVSAALADSYDNLGDVYHKMGSLEPAEQCYEQCKTLREQLARYFPTTHILQYANTMQKLAQTYREDNSLFQALVVISELAENLNAIDTWEDEWLVVERANACHNRALILGDLGNNKEARDLMLLAAQNYSYAAQEYNRIHNAEAADAYCQAGNYCCNIDNYPDAEAYYKKALQLSKELYQSGDMPAHAMVGALNNLGRTYFSMQNMEEAKKCYEQGRHIIESDTRNDSDMETILTSAIIKLNIVEYYIYEKNSGIDDNEYSNCVKYLEDTISTLKPFAGNSSVAQYYEQAKMLLKNILN